LLFWFFPPFRGVFRVGVGLWFFFRGFIRSLFFCVVSRVWDLRSFVFLFFLFFGRFFLLQLPLFFVVWSCCECVPRAAMTWDIFHSYRSLCILFLSLACSGSPRGVLLVVWLLEWLSLPSYPQSSDCALSSTLNRSLFRKTSPLFSPSAPL